MQLFHHFLLVRWITRGHCLRKVVSLWRVGQMSKRMAAGREISVVDSARQSEKKRAKVLLVNGAPSHNWERCCYSYFRGYTWTHFGISLSDKKLQQLYISGNTGKYLKLDQWNAQISEPSRQFGVSDIAHLGGWGVNETSGLETNWCTKISQGSIINQPKVPTLICPPPQEVRCIVQIEASRSEAKQRWNLDEEGSIALF